MKIPNWALKIINKEQCKEIEAAVVSAEKHTSGEIVPMIVEGSSTLRHIPPWLFMICVLGFFALDIDTFFLEYFSEEIFAYIFSIVLALLLAFILSKSTCLQRLMVPSADREEQVLVRAQLEFYNSNIKNTKDSTGVLLFVSLFEKRAVVLADKSINEKVDQEIWQEVCDILVQGIRNKEVSEGFCNAIAKCQEILTPHFPIQEDDTNELRDHLIIKS